MDIVQESRKLAISEIEKFGLPNLVHFEISEKKAIELAEKLNADKRIVQIGVYLMDLKLGQAFKDDKVSQHVQMSAEAARKFLSRFGIDEISRQKVLNCVEAHHGTIPFDCVEAEICANADCYRFIHPKGFFVLLTILGKRNPNFSASLDMAEEKLDEKWKILSLDFCKKELRGAYKDLKKYIKMARKL